MKRAFLSFFLSFVLSRNGIVDFIRNNKSQHIKISYYKVCRRPSLSLLLAQNVAGREEERRADFPPPPLPFLRLTYHTALITRVVIIIRLL